MHCLFQVKASEGWGLAVALIFLLVGNLGCQRNLPMAKAYEKGLPNTTIRYIGVPKETRLYPDYGSINATILSPSKTPRSP